MTAPHRIQLRRARGWRMPPNTVHCGRPFRWGNPYLVSEYGQAEAVRLHREDLLARRLVNEHGQHVTVEDVRRELAGRDLACWCPLDWPCHADTLLEVANAGVGESAADTAQRLGYTGGGA